MKEGLKAAFCRPPTELMAEVSVQGSRNGRHQGTPGGPSTVLCVLELSVIILTFLLTQLGQAAVWRPHSWMVGYCHQRAAGTLGLFLVIAGMASAQFLNEICIGTPQTASQIDQVAPTHFGTSWSWIELFTHSCSWPPSLLPLGVVATWTNFAPLHACRCAGQPLKLWASLQWQRSAGFFFWPNVLFC